MKSKIVNGYDLGIDFVRFIAFFLVFLHHFAYKGGNSLSQHPDAYWTNAYIDSIAFFGSEGVTIFFCLSGYLLSRILISELVNTGKLSVKSFYLRRILRIWPLYFAFIIICILINPLMGNQKLMNSELPFLLSFTYNWQQLFTGNSRGMAAILWSISVEEQIYLLLPLLLLLFHRSGIKKLAILLIAIGFSCRIVFFINDLNLYRNTFSYMSTIGIGMFFAIYERSARIWFNRNRNLLRFVLISIIIGYIYLFKLIFSVGSLGIIAFDLTAMVSIFLLLILSGNERGHANRIIRFFAYFGRRTYGMYIYHWPVLGFMVSRGIFYDEVVGISIHGLVIAFICVVLISVISYRFFEKPFLDLRKKYQFIKIG